MEVPAFKVLEDRLRQFFGRACQELTKHHADPLDRFVRPPFANDKNRKPPTSLEHLEYDDYTRILTWNTSLDRRERVSRLFERHILPSLAVPSEMRYCGSLRNKYAHLKGVGEAVSRREQLADIIILRRVVAAIARLGVMDDFDRGLLSQLDELAEGLLADIAKSHLPVTPSDQAHIDVDLLSAPIAGDVVAAIPSRQALNASAPSEGIAAVLVALAEVQVAVVSLHKKVVDPRELERRLDALSELLARLHLQRASMSQQDHAPEFDAISGAYVGSRDGENGSTAFEWDLVGLSDATPIPSTEGVRRKHRPRPLSRDEAREELVALRSRIWAEQGSGPSSDGLLRRSMLEAFLQHRPSTDQEVTSGPIGGLLLTVHPTQRDYLADVLAIVSRIET